MTKKGVVVVQCSLILAALAIGVFGFRYSNQLSGQSEITGWRIVGTAILVLGTSVAGCILNILLHESGHLIGGLLTGYKFIFFSALGVTVINTREGLVIKRYTAPGTAGGCLLSPPMMNEDTYPFKLYISGGFLVNILTSIICGIFFYLSASVNPTAAKMLLIIGLIAALLGLLNFIPHNVIAPSDGYILFNLGKKENSAMRHGLWSCFQIQALNAEGVRLRDISVDLLDWVNIKEITDPFALETAYYRYGYFLDKRNMEDAKEIIQILCKNPYNVSEVQKMSCYCELLFQELIGACRRETIEEIYSAKLDEFVHAASSEISIQRVMYAYAKLFLADEAEAKKHLLLFQEATTIPIQAGTAIGEKELIAFIDTVVAARETTI